jgi:hypothetical protein
MLQRHEGNAIAPLAQPQQAGGQLLGVETFKQLRAAFDVELRQMVLRVTHGIAQHADKTVAAIGQ